MRKTLFILAAFFILFSSLGYAVDESVEATIISPKNGAVIANQSFWINVSTNSTTSCYYHLSDRLIKLDSSDGLVHSKFLAISNNAINTYYTLTVACVNAELKRSSFITAKYNLLDVQMKNEILDLLNSSSFKTIKNSDMCIIIKNDNKSEYYSFTVQISSGNPNEIDY